MATNTVQLSPIQNSSGQQNTSVYAIPKNLRYTDLVYQLDPNSQFYDPSTFIDIQILVSFDGGKTYPRSFGAGGYGIPQGSVNPRTGQPFPPLGVEIHAADIPGATHLKGWTYSHLASDFDNNVDYSQWTPVAVTYGTQAILS